MESKQPESISLTQKFVSGELQFGFWGVIARCIGWVNAYFVISSISVFDYGLFQLFLATYAIAAEFVSWGGLAAGTEILRFVGRGDEASAKRLFFEFNGLRLVTAILFWAFFFFVAPLGFANQPAMAGFVRIMSFMFLSDFVLAAVTTLVNMRLDFKALSSRRSIGKMFQFFILIGFYMFSKISLNTVFLSLVVGHVLATTLLIPAAVRAWKPWRGIAIPKGPSVLVKVARAHGKWDSIKNILSQFANQSEPWLINIFVSTTAVGIYSVGSTLAELVMQTIPRNTMNVLITRVFHDRERSQKVFTYVNKYLAIWGLIGMVGSAIVVPIVIYFFLPQYLSSLPFFYLLLLANPIKSFQWMVDMFLRVFRKQKFSFFRGVTRSALVFVLLLVLMPLIGIWAVPLTEILMRLSVAFAGYRYLLKMRPEFEITPELLFSFGSEDRKILRGIFTQVKLVFRRLAF